MVSIFIGARVDEGEFNRAMANRNCKSTTELMRELIAEAARAPPKRSHKKKSAKCNHIVHDLQKPAPVIRGESQLPPSIINDMKFLLIDREKRGQVCTREWMARYLRENYPLETSVGLEAMLDTIFTIIKGR